jgi:hypothetical protein
MYRCGVALTIGDVAAGIGASEERVRRAFDVLVEHGLVEPAIVGPPFGDLYVAQPYRPEECEALRVALISRVLDTSMPQIEAVADALLKWGTIAGDTVIDIITETRRAA